MGSASHKHYDRERWVEGFQNQKPVKSFQCRVFKTGYTKLGKRCPYGKMNVATIDWLCDSWASICIGSRGLVSELGMREDNLLPSSFKISSADSSNMRVLGMVLMELERGTRKTVQQVYICEGTRMHLLSFDACVKLGFMRENLAEYKAAQAQVQGETIEMK